MNKACIFLLLFTIRTLCTTGTVNGNIEVYRSNCKKRAAFQLLGKNTRLDVAVIATDVATTSTVCSLKCTHDSLCKSINYNVDTKKCEKLSGNRATVGETQLVTSKMWEHYEPVDLQQVCSRKFNKYPCSPRQKCEEDYTKVEGYRCIDLQNIALGKATKNEPNDPGHPPSRAVDGIADKYFMNGYCQHTMSEKCCSPLPWWRVDFGSLAIVYATNVTNREDCCEERLFDFNVRVGNSIVGRGEQNELCIKNGSVPKAAASTFICNSPLYGRYLYIQTNLQMDLVMCEVEVFGEMCH